MQFWPPDDEHMCWKHVEAWNKLIVKQNFCASSWLITEINILYAVVVTVRYVYFMPLYVSSTYAHHQEVKIALHSLWYHHTYRCDDTRGCAMQFWPPDDEHMCSKHAEARNKLIVKQKFCASTWLITEISILRCTVSKTSKLALSVFSFPVHNLLELMFQNKPFAWTLQASR